ncbi:hypothetical protein [Flavobacterium silvaticum]|uniref:Hemolysin III n=1 Tax=Flavobacterium silvaticum TaxID=1852020 RepID=A0A972FMJ1_9FLAO|nr:hypothetical protein [Flavobacterium silvaticum]NMH27970.1 hypothetical protein [Flavobacterium silvaticum]
MESTRLPADGGMLYTETNLDRLFPEPLNFISSLLFLGIACFWLWKLRDDYPKYPFLLYCALLLLVGAIGGGVYHGFRLWRPFIMMDWLPIMLLCISAAIHFLIRVSRWYIAIGIVSVYIAFTFWMRSHLDSVTNIQFWINLNYTLMALLVVVPVFWFLATHSFRFGQYVLLALLCFSVAIIFRIADGWNWLSSGTHFLWHTFGAFATALMLQFLYKVRSAEITS